jgi:predicted HNH restriction endonuclease
LHHIAGRNGSWTLMSNTRNEDILVLCPTCHALIHRGVCTLEELGF